MRLSGLESRSRAAATDLDAWVDDARRGGQEGFTQLWLALSPRVHRYVRSRGASSPDDLTSEVFVQAIRDFPRFRGRGDDFRAWLFTIAHHRLVDELRRPTATVPLPETYEAVGSGGADEDLVDQLLDPALEDALRSLTAAQAEVLLLRSLGEMSTQQVAEATGRSCDAVKQLHRRAAAAARAALERGRSAPPRNARHDGAAAATLIPSCTAQES